MYKLVLAMPHELKEELLKEAEEKSLTLNAYIRLILLERKK